MQLLRCSKVHGTVSFFCFFFTYSYLIIQVEIQLHGKLSEAWKGFFRDLVTLRERPWNETTVFLPYLYHVASL